MQDLQNRFGGRNVRMYKIYVVVLERAEAGEFLNACPTASLKSQLGWCKANMLSWLLVSPIMILYSSAYIVLE